MLTARHQCLQRANCRRQKGQRRLYRVPQNRKPRESPLEASDGTIKRAFDRGFAFRKHLYQSVLNTLAAPTLVVLHFPVQAFQAEKSFQLAWACLK